MLSKTKQITLHESDKELANSSLECTGFLLEGLFISCFQLDTA